MEGGIRWWVMVIYQERLREVYRESLREVEIKVEREDMANVFQ